MADHRIELPTEPIETLRIVAKTAELWGAKWEPGADGGHLEIPVLAGLRRGWVLGQVQIEKTDGGSRLVFTQEESIYRVQLAAASILALAACGAITILIAPLFPKLLGLVPVSMMLCIGAWFFVVARLRNSGPEEFFDELLVGSDPKTKLVVD